MNLDSQNRESDRIEPCGADPWDPDNWEGDGIDRMILFLAQIFEEANNRTSVVIPKKVNQVLETATMLKRAFANTDVQVDCKLHEPYIWSGCVTLRGNEIAFEDVEILLEAIHRASNFDMYIADEKVQIDLSFDGLTRAIEEE